MHQIYNSVNCITLLKNLPIALLIILQHKPTKNTTFNTINKTFMSTILHYQLQKHTNHIKLLILDPEIHILPPPHKKSSYTEVSVFNSCVQFYYTSHLTNNGNMQLKRLDWGTITKARKLI